MTTDTSLKAWEREYANRIVDGVNSARERRGWTIARLGSELRKFGWAVSTETLNGILSARKRGSFSVGEVFCFGRALSLPPLYLMGGFPSADPLPEGPLVPENDVVSVFEWLTDSELRILDASPFGFLPSYARAVSNAKWHNALWLASDGKFGSEFLAEDISAIARKRQQWRDFAANGFDLPEIPALPVALEGMDDAPSHRPHVPAPWDEFSGEVWMERAREYIARLEASEAERNNLRRAERGAPADTAE